MTSLRPRKGLVQPALSPPMLRCPVTLLFGLPLTIEDFLARFNAEDAEDTKGAQSACRSDFLTRYDNRKLPCEGWNKNRLRWWSARYEPNVAQPLVNLARHAMSLGCSVHKRATLANLGAAARGDSVVILVSHWKGPEFSNDDFLWSSTQELVSRLEKVDHPLAAAILRSMKPQNKWITLARRDPLDGREALRRCLDATIEDQKTAGDVHYELDVTRQACRRDLLDEWLNGLIRPGNRLELFDGLHDHKDVASAISPDFVGVLDLTICTSTYLGDRLGHVAKQRYRTVQFLKPQEFFEESIRINLVMTLFAQSDLTYLAARASVGEAYKKLVDDIGRRGIKGGLF
jgi:hypothetical protein